MGIFNIFKKPVSPKNLHSVPKEAKSKRKGFTFKERDEHYKGVASGVVAPKADSKYTAAEQIAYAKARVDVKNEQKRAYAWKNASEKQRTEYNAKQSAKRAEYKAKKGK